MLCERYDPMNLFEYIAALGMETDAVLTQLDTLLDDDVLFQAVKQDLSQRFPRTSCFGRPSTPIEVIVRMLVVKYLFPITSQLLHRKLVLVAQTASGFHIQKERNITFYIRIPESLQRRKS